MRVRRIDKNRFIAWIGESTVKLELGFGLDSFGVGLSVGNDDGADFSIQLGLQIFLTFRLAPLTRFRRWFYDRFGEREYSLRWFGGCLWWDFHGKSMESSSRDPWWQRQTFHVKDWIIGAPKYSSELISSQRVSIPFPEGSYSWDIEMRRDTWAHSRWFTLTIIRCHAKCEGGTPSGHKGPTFGITMPAKNVYDAVGKITADIYKSRGNFNPKIERR